MPALAFTASAATQSYTPFHYVSLGDASTDGFGMADKTGYRTIVNGTYPALLRNAISSSQFDVDLDQLAMAGMRTEELRYLLDDNYNGDSYLQENFKNLANKRNDFRQSIAEADLITYGLGSVDFGSFLIYVAGDVDNRCDDAEIQALASADADNIKGALREAINAEKAKIDSTIMSTAEGAGFDIDALTSSYIDGAAYVYYSFCKSYDETIRLIKELNPDADILVLGLRNMLGDISIKASINTVAGPLNIGPLNIGSLYDQQLISKANQHMAGSTDIYGGSIVDTSNVETFLDEAAAYSGDPSTISSQFKRYCDVLEDDFLLKTAATNKLKNYIASKKTKGLNGAYDAAAVSLQSVANTSNISISASIDDLTYLRDNSETVSGLGKELMAGIKDMCLSVAEKAANDRAYTTTLSNFASGPLFGSIKVRPIGQIVMAIGIRTQMGDGFFQHPSAKGHKQISAALKAKYSDKILHIETCKATCLQNGVSKEFWQNVISGKCYSDEACTTETVKANNVTNALGHNFGKTKVTVKAKFCKDGKGVKTCSRCGATKTVTIAGLGPAKTKILKLTRAKKAFTVKWKKPSAANLKKTTGYQIRYSLKSSMANAKTVTVTKKATVSKKIKKLKAKKKYYVQVRTYKKANGKKYFSGWCTKKAVKTK